MKKDALVRICLILSAVSVSCAGAQVGLTFPQETCECTPRCEKIGPLKCFGGPSSGVPREDCPCCRVCLALSGEKCDPPGVPCDRRKGFTCRDGICQAATSCQVDTECPRDKYCLEGACVDPCVLLNPCSVAPRGTECVVQDHKPSCRCPEGSSLQESLNECLPDRGIFHPSQDLDDGKISNLFLENADNDLDKRLLGQVELDARKITHNSTVILLPTSEGGDLSYKETKSLEDYVNMKVQPGKKTVPLEGLRPRTQYTVFWSDAEGTTTKIFFKTKDGCTQDGVSYPAGATWEQGCNGTFSCRPEGHIDRTPLCVFTKGSISDPKCRELPSPGHPECCVIYECGQEDVSSQVTEATSETSRPAEEDRPKLIVTSKSQDSLTIAWDDFRGRTPDGRYVAEYRQHSEGGDLPWTAKTVPISSFAEPVILESLKPNSKYDIRVTIQGNEDDRRIEEVTETITAMTAAGCIEANASRPVGDFFRGCDATCVCSEDGIIACKERCHTPYFKRGTFTGDPLCLEKDSGFDECCVMVACSNKNGPVAHVIDPCKEVTCGPNAECTLRPLEEGAPLAACTCLAGFSGNASDLETGCRSVNWTSSHVCNYKNKTYQPGDVFYDGCDFECSCNANNELDCQPRCPVCSNEPSTDECCRTNICNATASGTDPSAVPTEGCIKDNVTYDSGEAFTDSCNRTCKCMGYGDVSCENNFARCPPTKITVASAMNCETLPDPSDPCCSITVCDEKTPDVLKENATEGTESVTMETGVMEDSGTTVFYDESSSLSLTLQHVVTEATTEDEEESLGSRTVLPINEEADDVTSTNQTQGDKEAQEEKLHELEESIKEITSMAVSDEEKAVRLQNLVDSIPKEELNMTTQDVEDMTKKNMMTLEKLRQNEDKVVAFIESNQEFPLKENDSEIIRNQIRDWVRQIYSDYVERERKIALSNDSDEQKADQRMKLLKQEFSGLQREVIKQLLKIENKTSELDIFPETSADEEQRTPPEKKFRFQNIADHELRIVRTTPVDATTIEMHVNVSDSVIDRFLASHDQYITVEYSHDSFNWTKQDISVSKIRIENLNEIVMNLENLQRGKTYQMRATFEGVSSPTIKASTMGHATAHDSIHTEVERSTEKVTHSEMLGLCLFDGKTYKVGDHFYKGCEEFCECGKGQEEYCRRIECPSRFGLEIIDPTCLKWEPIDQASRKPPNCCDELKCTQTSSCFYQGQEFKNNEVITTELTGCERECHCFYGNVTCNNVCSPVPALPPPNLPCSSQYAILAPTPRRECCKSWQCAGHAIPGPIFSEDPDFGLAPVPPGFPSVIPEKRITEPIITHVDEGTVDVQFIIPHLYMGLPGSLVIEYGKVDNDTTEGEREEEVVVKDGNIISDDTYHHTISGLTPGAKYNMQVRMTIHGIRKALTSPVVQYETEQPVTDLYVDGHLRVSEINKTRVKVSWGPFTKEESKYFDGVQVKYTPKGAYIPEFTRIFHRNNKDVILRDLKPGTEYTLELALHDIPNMKNKPNLISVSNIKFKTQPEEDPSDPYSFDLEISAGKISMQSVEIQYNGFPSPEEKYILVYNVMYKQTFPKDTRESSYRFVKVPKHSKARILSLQDLKPGIQYDIWVEALLTNGRKVTSNVINVITKTGLLPQPEKSTTYETEEDALKSYYTEYVICAIIAAVFLVVIVVGVLYQKVCRHNHAKAAISSKAPKGTYDNPTYDGDDYNSMEMNGMNKRNSDVS